MPSIVPGYQYDIFISYRQKDNKTGWVTEFVESLRNEIEATFKEEISIYFDSNPHDGLQETHDVDGSLKEKIKALIFIPIISQTYCDPKSFAWQNEFVPYVNFAKEDKFGLDVRLQDGNVSKRILPVRIHDIPEEDTSLFQNEVGGIMRPVDFIYKESGVNRPLSPDDSEEKNLNQTRYKNQVNKVANAIKNVIAGLQAPVEEPKTREGITQSEKEPQKFGEKVHRRDLVRAGITYMIVALLFWKVIDIASVMLDLTFNISRFLALLLILFFPIALIFAWLYEQSPEGFIRTSSSEAKKNPYSKSQRKPLTGTAVITILMITVVALFIVFPASSLSERSDLKAEESSIGIIPFRNNTGNDEFQHLGVGFASEVRTKLALSKRFDFISSEQATIDYQNSSEDPIRIGNELGVTHLLSGNYQIFDDELKVNVDLISSANGSILWSFPFQGKYEDIFKIQSEIAKQVMDKFSVQDVSKDDFSTLNLEAYNNYVKGNNIVFNTRNAVDRLESIPYFKKAIELDPNFVGAWVRLVRVYSYFHFNRTDDRRVTKDTIRAVINEIEKNFPPSWEKTLAKAIYHYQVELDYSAALQEFEEVLEDNPESAVAVSLIAAIYKRKLMFQESLRYRLKAIKLNPGSVINWSELAILFEFTNDYDNAFKAWTKVSEIDPNDPGLYDFLVSNNSLSALPEQAKRSWGNRYIIDSLWMERNLIGLKKVMDTIRPNENISEARYHFDKLWYYNYLSEDDSSKLHAVELLSLPDQNQIPGYMRYHAVFILRGEEEAKKIQESVYPIVDEDLARSYFRKVSYIIQLSYMRDNEGATTKLIELNQEYPQMGIYDFLNYPIFDRIKKEHPPFVDAINNLRYPPKLNEDNPLKW